MVPYKRFDLLIKIANQLQLPLVIVGEGSDKKRLRNLAGPTVQFLGRVKDEMLPRLYAEATALLFPQREDAGIVPMEAQACGTPVIAYGQGGVLDIVDDGVTGILVREQTTPAFLRVLQHFRKDHFDRALIRQRALRFHEERFKERILAEVSAAISSRSQQLNK